MSTHWPRCFAPILSRQEKVKVINKPVIGRATGGSMMSGTTRTWRFPVIGVRATTLFHYILACLVFFFVVHYITFAIVGQQLYVTTTSSLIDADNTKAPPELHYNSMTSLSPSYESRRHQLDHISVLRHRLLDFFSPGVVNNKRQKCDSTRELPACPAPSYHPVELNWSVGEDAAGQDESPVWNRSNSTRPRGRTTRLHQQHTIDRALGDLKLGGHWCPRNCSARHHIAIVVPYRDRLPLLDVFIRHIHPFLQRQLVDYRVFVVEQTAAARFNRGMLLNIGFIEARRRLSRDHCFFFHDVDLLPESDLNLYTCPRQPRHVSVAIDKFSYKLVYMKLFGGIEAFKPEHFELVNGFSNMFFGWGGEDDDMFQRVIFHRLNLTRYPGAIARYKMLKHQNEEPSLDRYKLIETGLERMEVDGLNSLCYNLRSVDRLKLYTRLLVDINEQYVRDAASNHSLSCPFNNREPA